MRLYRIPKQIKSNIILIVFALLLFALTFFAVVYVAQPGPLIGGYASVIDGDTIRLDGRRIRLVGIDAPERAQPKGYFSRQALQDLIGDGYEPHFVTCQDKGRDQFDRTLAKCFVDSVDLGRAMVRQGMAVAYYTDDYESEELLARKEKKGLWKGSFVRPSDYRRGVR